MSVFLNVNIFYEKKQIKNNLFISVAYWYVLFVFRAHDKYQTVDNHYMFLCKYYISLTFGERFTSCSVVVSMFN
jgi:hypothetical protein